MEKVRGRPEVRSDGVSLTQYSEAERLRAKFTISNGEVDFRPQALVELKRWIPGQGMVSVSGNEGIEYWCNLPDISPRELCRIMSRADADGKTVQFDGVGWGGGSIYLVDSQSRDGQASRQLITVVRDKGARVSPGTLGSMTGIGNSTDPMAAMLKEATEEVLITTGSGRVLVPQFLDQKYSLYNEIVRGNVIEVASGMELTPLDFGVSLGGLRSPHSLNGFPIRAVINYKNTSDGMDEAFESVDIALRPAIFRLSDLDDRSGVEFRDTLGIETKGKFPERAVAAIDVDTTEVKVYERGKLVDVYGTLVSFLSENRYISNSEFPLIPILAGIMRVVDSDAQLFRMARDPSFLRYHSPQRAEELKMQARE